MYPQTHGAPRVATCVEVMVSRVHWGQH